MLPTIDTCPHCGAPLPVTRFAATVVCRYCENTVRVDPSVVSARKYREAFAEWDAPAAGDGAQVIPVADTRWIAERLLARGEVSDVYLARRARWPGELAVLKVVRDAADAPLLEHEWRALQRLRQHAAQHGVDLGSRVPAPIVRDGRASACRWASGFVHTFETVRAAYPHGIPPVASIWLWRRILEVLGVMRQAGLVHGAILPNHLLVEDGEHGVRIVGFSCADSPDAPLRVISSDFARFYPASLLESRKLTPRADVVMSARCVADLLGDRDVPPPLAELLRNRGADDGADADPWKLHKELGELGKALFGPPAFHPIAITGT